MRALVGDGVERAAGVHDGHLGAVDLDREGGFGLDIVDGASGRKLTVATSELGVRDAPGRRADGDGQLGLDGGQQPLLDRGDADPADDVGEEAVHHQPAGLHLLDAPAAQVEKLLVVEPAGGGGVPGAGDLTGLDLQVGDRVGPAAVGQHQVAVGLIGLDAFGDLADQHVTDPDRVGALALQGPAVVDVGPGVRGVVVDEQPVLEVLAGVGEVEPELLDLPARAGVLGGLDQPDQIAAEACRQGAHCASRPTLTATWPACTASSSQSCMPTSSTLAPSPASRVTELAYSPSRGAPAPRSPWRTRRP